MNGIGDNHVTQKFVLSVKHHIGIYQGKKKGTKMGYIKSPEHFLNYIKKIIKLSGELNNESIL